MVMAANKGEDDAHLLCLGAALYICHRSHLLLEFFTLQLNFPQKRSFFL